MYFHTTLSVTIITSGFCSDQSKPSAAFRYKTFRFLLTRLVNTNLNL
jgi:hypothetical protein